MEEITGYSRSALKDFRSVATRIDSSCRHDDLSFEHHSIVPSLSPEMQKEFLQKASDENLLWKRLRGIAVEQFRDLKVLHLK